MARSRQSRLMNNRHEELSIGQIYEMSGLTPTNMLVMHNYKPLIPRKMYNYFIPEINNNSRSKDSSLNCLVIESNNKKYFYSPSMALMATMERKNEAEIREMLGENDNIPQNEKNKINQIIYYIKKGKSLENARNNPNTPRGYIGKYSHIEKKRIENILEKRCLEDVLFNGHAFRGLIPSKKTNEFYQVSQKQWLTFKNGEIIVPESLQSSCNCGFSQASFLKYEFEIIASACSHAELLRQTLETPSLGINVRLKNKYGNARIEKIHDLFNPFNLDYPENESLELRTIIRQGIYNYVIPQTYIEENFNDSNNYHKNYGFTWYRVELDSFLLSFKEIFNEEFYDLWMNNINENESTEYTCKYFGDFRSTGEFIPVDAIHDLDEDTKILKHKINGKWMNVKHRGRLNGSEGPIENYQFTHDRINNHEHKITDHSVPRNIEIIHTLEEMEPFIDFEMPFKVGVLDNGVKIYIRPYQMRDSK